MNFKYFDIHCHLNLDAFALDYEEALLRAREKGVGMIVVGTNKKTSERAIELAEKYPDVWAIIGLHPVEVPCEIFDAETYKKMAAHPRVVGIGECGFDFYREGHADFETQKAVFEAQIAIANEVKKPLMLHMRSGVDGKHNSYRYGLDILKSHAKVPGDAHFYSGTVEEGKEFVDLGFRLSFTGPITYIRDFDEVIRNTPLNMILSETDSPYASPVPYRGERAEPAYVTYVAEKIAEIKGEPLEKVLPQLVDNARKLFSI
ncbi:MAG: TatD family hydrolase [Patescibacteria group bacterium]